MRTLYVMCGPSGSGKTTYAKTHFQNCVYISRDDIRLSILKPNENYFSHEIEVYDKFVSSIAMYLTGAKDVVADAIHITPSSRNKLIRAIDKHLTIPQDYKIIYIWMDTPLEKCIENNNKRSGLAHVPKDTIITMYERATKPNFLENPDRITEIRIIKKGVI